MAEYRLANHDGGRWTIVWYRKEFNPKLWEKIRNNAKILGARYGLGPQTQADNDAYLDHVLNREGLEYREDGSVLDWETGGVYDWPMKKVFADSGIKNFPELVGNLVMFCLLARRASRAKAKAAAVSNVH
jgi:hypothetical protein